jgi:F-type H+-transporting ATPase subunit a
MEHAFSWYGFAESFFHPLSALPEPNFMAIIVALVILALALGFHRGLARSSDPVIPDDRLGARSIMEILLELVVGLSDSIIGHKGRKYVPLFGSLFIFILVANLMGLIPGFVPPTSYFFANLALGLVVFVAYNYYGVREHGAHYFKQFLGPVFFLAPLLILIEVFSHAFRPLSLSIRLFGNMFGDHLVLEIFTGLTKLVIPVVFYILGTLVSVIQAAVFTILSIIYVAMAISHEH